MAKVNSIKKGHRFELEIAKWLTKQTGVAWHRVPMSGGAASIHGLESWHGDVFSEASNYKDLVVECKSYKKPVTLADFNNPRSLLNQWIAQTRKESGVRMWLLFFKTKRSPTFLLMPSTDDIRYPQTDNLSFLCATCKYVCQTKEWMLFQVGSDSNSSE